MKINDLVIRKIDTKNRGKLHVEAARRQRERLGVGIVLERKMGGSNPVHPVLTVYYSNTKEIYDIAESLMEMISEQ